MKYVELSGGACSDCVQAIANNDYSGMDDETEARVRTALEKFGQGGKDLTVGDEDLGFCHSRCAVCGGLPGDRTQVGYLVDEDDSGKEEEEADEPDEDAITTSDGRSFFQYGKLVLTVGEDEDRDEALREFMNDARFWPDAWAISDHGNAHRIDLSA